MPVEEIIIYYLKRKESRARIAEKLKCTNHVLMKVRRHSDTVRARRIRRQIMLRILKHIFNLVFFCLRYDYSDCEGEGNETGEIECTANKGRDKKVPKISILSRKNENIRRKRQKDRGVKLGRKVWDDKKDE